ADGIYFLPLISLKDPLSLSQVVYSTLDNLAPKESINFNQLVEILRDKRMLLIFDAVEHLLQHGGYTGEQLDASAFVHALLQAAPGIKCLVASSLPLYLRAEWRFALRGLAFPTTLDSVDQDERLREYSAVDLFWRTARRIKTSLTPSPDDWVAIVEI